MHKFKVTRSEPVEEIHCHLTEAIHEPTGARVLHLGNDDPENVFCLSFSTHPESSNGIAHILEHTVLCGSEKYPIKDPFFSMTRRSLNTFMNAFTGQDFTCYPAASQVPTDFYNLLSVYYDAVFHPLLDRRSFAQEGHRQEFAEPEDPSSPLEFKGIVYNEMKGGMASPFSRLHEALNKHLFSNLCYRFNSGGNPKEIPNLTYEELKAFHASAYHPSRCLFYFYGNIPLEEHLEFLDKKLTCEKLPPLTPMLSQKRYSEPVSVHARYPIALADLKGRTLIALSFLTCPIEDQETVLALMLLDSILMENDASLLRRALLETGLCTRARSSLDAEMRDVPWVLTISGCEPEAAEPLKKVLQETLSKLVREGIPTDLIEGALHQLEFHRSEIGGDSYPFGLSLFFRSGLVSQHGVDPAEGLKIHSAIAKIRGKPGLFEKLITRYFLENPHSVTVTLVPDPHLEEEELEAERTTLTTLKEQLPKELLIAQAKELAHFQQEQEGQAIDCLPKLSLKDVPIQGVEYSLEQEGAALFRHTTFTNQIAYLSHYYPLPALPTEELAALSLLADLIGEVGQGGKSYTQTLEELQATTGGFDATLHLSIPATDPTPFHTGLIVSGKALDRNAEALYTHFDEAAQTLDFNDRERIHEVLLKRHTALINSLAQQGMHYAHLRSGASFRGAAAWQDQWAGIPYLWTLNQWVTEFDTEWPKLQATLERLHQTAFQNPTVILTAGSSLPSPTRWNQPPSTRQEVPAIAPRPPEDEAWDLPTPVAFTSQAREGVGYTDAASPAYAVAANLMENTLLHPLLREQGGAYGGGCRYNPTSGLIRFFAYRDPNIASTLKAFEQATAALCQGKFSDTDLEEAKLQVFQGLDNPVAPGSRGALAYFRLQEEKDPTTRQQWRDKLRMTDRETIVNTAKAIGSQQGVTVICAGKELIEREKFAARAKSPLKSIFE